MASDDEVRRLILEVIGEDKVRALKEQIDQEKESLIRLTSALSHLTEEQIASDKGIQFVTQNLIALNRQLRETEGSHLNAGRAVLELSRGIEDLQYGIGGVLNNIPSLVMALGGGAGLTGVISLLAVGINQLVKNYMPDWEGGVAKVKEKHEKLTDAVKAEIEAIKKLQETETDATERRKKEMGGAAVEAIAPHREEIRSALTRQLREEGREDLQRLLNREYELATSYPTPDKVSELYDVRQQIKRQRAMMPEAVRARRADVILGRAEMGGAAELARVTALFPQETQIGAALREAGPERIQQRQEEERDVARQIRMAKTDEEIAQNNKKLAEEDARAKKKVEDERLAIETAHMRAIEDAQKIEEDAKKNAARESSRAAEYAKREADHARRAAEASAQHEASLLDQSFGDRAQLVAKQAMAQGFGKKAIEQNLAKQFMGAGATQLGAQKAAQEQMEKVLVDINKNGSLAASLILQQSKLQSAMIRAQRHIADQLQEANGELQRNWDQAGRRGR